MIGRPTNRRGAGTRPGENVKTKTRIKTALAEPLREGRETAVLARAVEVIGDKREAMRWMGTPVRDLAYATPVSLLHSEKGRTAVMGVLARLEHGVL